MNIDVSPNGAGLPPGSGTPEQGAAVYAASCASCHGANGEGKPPAYPQLDRRPEGTFDFASDYKIPRTIGNYWPYATTLYDYIRRAMPLTAPGSLTAEQTYAVTAYLLNREGIVPAGHVARCASRWRRCRCRRGAISWPTIVAGRSAARTCAERLSAQRSDAAQLLNARTLQRRLSGELASSRAP